MIVAMEQSGISGCCKSEHGTDVIVRAYRRLMLKAKSFLAGRSENMTEKNYMYRNTCMNDAVDAIVDVMIGYDAIVPTL